MNGHGTMAKYYVVTTGIRSDIESPRISLDAPIWFAYEDGHYSTNVPFRRATAATNLVDAGRMLEYARSTYCASAQIVTVGALEVFPVDLDGDIHNELVEAARNKLTELELKALLKEYGNVQS